MSDVRCAPRLGWASTPATSAGCCARSRTRAWSTVEPDAVDGRVRPVRLHRRRAGRARGDGRPERRPGLVAARPARRRAHGRLLEAMATVERLLTAGQVEVAVEDPHSADADACLQAYFAEIDERFETGFDFDAAEPFAVDDMVEPEGLLLVARLDGEPVGCGALHFFPDGGGRREAHVGRRRGPRARARAPPAGRAGGRGPAPRRATLLRLETNRSLVEAIALYRAVGLHRGRPLQRRGPRPPLVRQAPPLTVLDAAVSETGASERSGSAAVVERVMPAAVALRAAVDGTVEAAGRRPPRPAGDARPLGQRPAGRGARRQPTATRSPSPPARPGTPGIPLVLVLASSGADVHRGGRRPRRLGPGGQGAGGVLGDRPRSSPR